MKESIKDRVIKSLKLATGHNSHVMTRPEAILWLDPERQWESIIPTLQQELPYLLVFGEYDPASRRGPAIWIKCMVSNLLPEAQWKETDIPIIYMPGISKQDFKNITSAGLLLQPLMEYQYTGTIWLHENGKEWTVAAFIQNEEVGMGTKMAQDTGTKDALLRALPGIFNEKEYFYRREFVDADSLLTNVFPDVAGGVLRWMSDPDIFLSTLSTSQQATFVSLCRSRFGFDPDYKNIKNIAEKLGSRRDAWSHVWDYYSNAPKKFPRIEELLRLAKPEDLGVGVFELPHGSWPQVNEQEESDLREALQKAAKQKSTDILEYLNRLTDKHAGRKSTVWYELGYAPLVDALGHLIEMTRQCAEAYPFGSLKELAAYYVDKGHKSDQHMRKALAAVQTKDDRNTVIKVIGHVYKPWLEKITEKFQQLVNKDVGLFTASSKEPTETCILFVDALRYELAVEFTSRLQSAGYEVTLSPSWSALPSLTPTAKPNVSPIKSLVSKTSECNEFRPQLTGGKDLQTAAFREALTQVGFSFVQNAEDIDPQQRVWLEIGDIDTKGHQEQSMMIRRIDELYQMFQETIQTAFARGVKRIKVVTDHGWLLLPGGLPKTELSKHLTETRWGRCALLKEGADTELLHLSWTWNPAIFVAYAPGITFFKKNEEYAHGGLSLQECLIPEMIIAPIKGKQIGGAITSVVWNNRICKVEAKATDGYRVDIRTKATDESTSIVLSVAEKRILREGKVSLMVDDSSEGSAAWVILATPEGIVVDKKMTSVGQQL